MKRALASLAALLMMVSGCACVVEFVIPPNVDCKMIGGR